jgi:hypothetical protein
MFPAKYVNVPSFDPNAVLGVHTINMVYPKYVITPEIQAYYDYAIKNQGNKNVLFRFLAAADVARREHGDSLMADWLYYFYIPKMINNGGVDWIGKEPIEYTGVNVTTDQGSSYNVPRYQFVASNQFGMALASTPVGNTFDGAVLGRVRGYLPTYSSGEWTTFLITAAIMVAVVATAGALAPAAPGAAAGGAAAGSAAGGAELATPGLLSTIPEAAPGTFLPTITGAVPTTLVSTGAEGLALPTVAGAAPVGVAAGGSLFPSLSQIQSVVGTITGAGKVINTAAQSFKSKVQTTKQAPAPISQPQAADPSQALLIGGGLLLLFKYLL